MPSAMAPVTEAWRTAVTARVTAANELLDEAVADLTLEQINHAERPGVLSIAFSLAHVVGGQDRSMGRYVTKTPMLWDSADWAKRVRLTGELPVRGTPMAEAERIRIGDLGAWREYQSAVFAQTESTLTNAPLEVFERDAFDGQRPPSAPGSFLFLLVPSGTIRVRDVIEAYVCQHASRHLGEIEHARALVGLRGLS